MNTNKQIRKAILKDLRGVVPNELLQKEVKEVLLRHLPDADVTFQPGDRVSLQYGRNQWVPGIVVTAKKRIGVLISPLSSTYVSPPVGAEKVRTRDEAGGVEDEAALLTGPLSRGTSTAMTKKVEAAREVYRKRYL